MENRDFVGLIAIAKFDKGKKKWRLVSLCESLPCCCSASCRLASLFPIAGQAGFGARVSSFHRRDCSASLFSPICEQVSIFSCFLGQIRCDWRIGGTVA